VRLVTLKLPLRIVDDDDLLRVSEANPGYQFEREADGTLTASATHADSGAQSAEAVYQLKVYAKRCGGRVFDSSTGFRIGRAVKSPDAAWVSEANVARLAVERRPGFWPERPDVAIEIRSASDSFAALVRKLHFYVKN
jgi:Uma2 family endonuclease